MACFLEFHFLKKHKLHMHLGQNYLFIEFLKSTKFVTDLIFSRSGFYI